MDKYGNPFSFSVPPCYNPEILVLSGGAIRGVYLLGVMSSLKKILGKIETYIGISSGAIICFLITIGFTPYEIFISLLKNDNFLSINMGKYIKPMSKAVNRENDGGLFSARNIFNHVKHQMDLKKISSDITFREHFELTGKRLMIMAFNVTCSREDIFTHDTTPSLQILKALKLSAGLPIIFSPTTYNNNWYVDGGVWNNFPINIALNHRKNEDIPILAISTLNSLYDSNFFKLYSSPNLNVIMVEDATTYNPDLEKYTMYFAGCEKGEKLVKVK